VCADNLIVLAAASTTEAMNEIGTLFAKKSGHTVQFSFGSAGALARQIQNGAPADLFVSANEKWMDALAGDVESRVDLLKNRLVLIAPKGRNATLDENFTGRLAVGNMESVPAGMYAKQVLEKKGWLEILKPRLVSCDSVRNVLFFVERGEADAGIVYSTDAKISDRVTVVSVFPEELHDPIRYPAAVCRASKYPDAARELLAFLQSPEAAEIFKRYGFER
jgi:molybdate transport system substrate-binding protein